MIDKLDKDCINDLEALRKTYGYSRYDRCVKHLNRQRLLNRERDPHQHFPPRVYQRLFDAQKGLCGICGDQLEFPANRNEIDRKDPNADDYNGRSNLQLVHGRLSVQKCNQKKGAKSMLDQCKCSGDSMLALIAGQQCG